MAQKKAPSQIKYSEPKSYFPKEIQAKYFGKGKKSTTKKK